jgi:hypothetical protein
MAMPEAEAAINKKTTAAVNANFGFFRPLIFHRIAVRFPQLLLSLRVLAQRAP